MTRFSIARRRFSASVLALAALPFLKGIAHAAGTGRALVGEAASFIPTTGTRHLVDPDLLAVLDNGVPASFLKPLSVTEAGRAGRKVRLSEHSVPSPGSPDVRVVVIAPADHGAKPLPAFLFIHGGGYMRGQVGQMIPLSMDIAENVGCVIVLPDYRLAPQTPFPGSLNDNHAALRWMHDHAAQLNIDPDRIAIGGGSAGAGHAAMLAIYERDHGKLPIKGQVLLSPMLDDRTGSTRDPGRNVGEFIWTPAKNRDGWSALLGVPAGSERVPEGAVPARQPDLTALPPAYLSIGSIDLFLDDTIEYARRLMHAGVSTDLDIFAGGYHGFSSFVPDAPISRRHDVAFQSALRRMLFPRG